MANLLRLTEPCSDEAVMGSRGRTRRQGRGQL